MNFAYCGHEFVTSVTGSLAFPSGSWNSVLGYGVDGLAVWIPGGVRDLLFSKTSRRVLRPTHARNHRLSKLFMGVKTARAWCWYTYLLPRLPSCHGKRKLSLLLLAHTSYYGLACWIIFIPRVSAPIGQGPFHLTRPHHYTQTQHNR